MAGDTTLCNVFIQGGPQDSGVSSAQNTISVNFLDEDSEKLWHQI